MINRRFVFKSRCYNWYKSGLYPKPASIGFAVKTLVRICDRNALKMVYFALFQSRMRHVLVGRGLKFSCRMERVLYCLKDSSENYCKVQRQGFVKKGFPRLADSHDPTLFILAAVMYTFQRRATSAKWVRRWRIRRDGATIFAYCGFKRCKV